MQGWYLGALIFSLLGMALLDYRYKIALFANPLRTAATLGGSVLAFLLWDLICIEARVFFEGQNDLLLGLRIYPHLPIEEPLFLLLLCYVSLILFRLATRWDKSRESK